jgi:hypothetical protein
MDCATHWHEPHPTDGRQILHVQFSMGLRQASRYGSMTRPKVQIDRVYAVERPDGKTVWVRLYRQRPGRDGERLFWAKRVKKPRNWPE